ncbi:MAG TPA: GNAT family N-acetyltransferase [Kiloniellaceae bacterium]|nr:GNAT family N-acetyltransferase [Kiloniellaceae bacterium]
MTTETLAPETSVEPLTALKGTDLHDLCDAAEAAILDGGGFGWLRPPPREIMESYWSGVMLVPERRLFVARLDGTVAGSAQLVRTPRNNEAQSSCGSLTTFFIAPWARGHGLAPRLVQCVEAAARACNMSVLNLDVRETQRRAIQVYEQLGFRRFGEHPRYAFVGGRWLTGYYYWKDLEADPFGADAGEAS